MKSKTLIILGSIAAVILLLLILGLTPFGVVPSGHIGVVNTWGKVSAETLPPGFTMKGIFSSIISMKIMTDVYETEMLAFSKDTQEVTVSIAVSYNLKPDYARAMYIDVGADWFKVLVLPRLPETVKNVTKMYTAAELVENREKIAPFVYSNLHDEMDALGINITDISIKDVDFSDLYTDAVEQKAVATQLALASKIEQQRLDDVAEAEAGRARVVADTTLYEANKRADAWAYETKVSAEAEALAIALRAGAEAEGNEKIASSLTELLVDYVYRQRWNGAVPQYNFGGSGDVLPVLQLPQD